MLPVKTGVKRLKRNWKNQLKHSLIMTGVKRSAEMFWFWTGRENHVRAGTLPQLLHQLFQVLLHLVCRRCKRSLNRHMFPFLSKVPFTHSSSSSSSSSQTSQIGLNFASEEEARRFRVAINDLLNRRQRKTGASSSTRLLLFLCCVSTLVTSLSSCR